MPSRGRYSRLKTEQVEIGDCDNSNSNSNDDDIVTQESTEMPFNPPSYHDLETNSPNVEELDIEESIEFQQARRISQLTINIINKIIDILKHKIVYPSYYMWQTVSNFVDMYLGTIGNPLILRRFVYIIIMSLLVYVINLSGQLPNKDSPGRLTSFSNQAQIFEYAKASIDYAKMEEDLEYLSSMNHQAGTKGDLVMASYVEESFNNNGLKLVTNRPYKTFVNYPGRLNLTIRESGGTIIKLEVDENNFNPLSVKGDINNASLLYGHYGTMSDFKKMHDKGLLNDNIVILLHYDVLVSEQILWAQKYNVKGIIFISNPLGDDKNVIQRRQVGLPQYGTGNPITPGWSSSFPERIKPEDSEMMPKIPTLPISWNQALELRKFFSKESSIDFGDDWFSGILGDVQIDLNITPTDRPEQENWNIIGKIQGKEQDDKAIMIIASRDASYAGASYPNFGQMILLSLVQLFQQVKYKYDWVPLRNIYFVSYDSSYFNFAGATELLESELTKIKNEIYTIIDISCLGIDPDGKKELDIQANPFLHRLFLQDTDKMGFDLNVRHVQSYGDWTPFMANGIPVAVISAPHILQWKPPIDTPNDTFVNLKSLLEKENGWERAADILLYTFQITLKMIDDPLIPLNLMDFVDTVNTFFTELQHMTEVILDYNPVLEGLLMWKKISTDWMIWIKTWNKIVMSSEESVEPSLVSIHRWTWNKKLSNIERRLCTHDGIPNRSWFKSIIFGPTLWKQENTDSWTFPGVRDALIDQDWGRAQYQIDVLGDILKTAAKNFMDETTDSG